MKTIKKKLLNLFKIQLATARWGTLSSQDLELIKTCVMDHGMESKLYQKFTKVFSGHYHTRSNDGRIFYIGNPYEMFWNDVNDDRGFHHLRY